jgi:hypothetical protein
VGVNPYRNTVSVRSNNTGNVFSENVTDLAVAKGCLGAVCAGQTVYKGTEYSRGAKVMGLNPNRPSATVMSLNTSNLFEEALSSLDVTTGCAAHGVCVGKKVYKAAEYSQGATVVGVNRATRTATVRSNNTGNVFKENLADLDITTGCVYGICVGDTVYKGSEYSNGALVVAVNAQAQSVVVRSRTSGNVFKEAATSLDVTDMCNDYNDDVRRESMRGAHYNPRPRPRHPR